MKPEMKAKKLKVSKKKGNSRLIIAVVGVIVLALIANAFLSGDSGTKETKKTEDTICLNQPNIFLKESYQQTQNM